jgi:hypothetical protein
MEKITKDQFVLERIKLDKSGNGAEIGYVIESISEKGTNYDSHGFGSHKIPHTDLTSRLNALKKIMVQTSGRCIEIGLLVEEKTKYRVMGISISGGEEKGVIIIGTYECQNGAKICVLTPRIKLDEDIFGIEKELQKAVDELTSEAFQYVYENKMSQLAMNFTE